LACLQFKEITETCFTASARSHIVDDIILLGKRFLKTKEILRTEQCPESFTERCPETSQLGINS
jgi:hypothetical protein